MFDFIFRRGNPTNGWQRSPNLALDAVLDVPSLNGITLGSRVDRLSSLGRSDKSSLAGYLCYFDLGLTVDHSKDEVFDGFSIVFDDDEGGEFQPYRDILTWKQKQLNSHDLTLDNLPSVFGEWHWLDTDEDESIAFYEYPEYEMQVETDQSGAVKRITLTNEPLMADPEQRDAYKVDKPWPPQ